MLRYFAVENWKSISNTAELTMIATPERKRSHTLYRSLRNRVLPLTAIFGANAAGKSSLIQALSWLRDAVSNNSKIPLVIPNKTFGINEPTSFEIEFVVKAEEKGKVKEIPLLYTLSVQKDRVVSEALCRVSWKRDVMLFERTSGNRPSIEADDDVLDSQSLKVLQDYVADDELLLTRLATKNSNLLIDAAVNWFRSNLVIISPNAEDPRMWKMLAEDAEFNRAFVNLLSTADTGITSIGFEEVPQSKLPQKAMDYVLGNMERHSVKNAVLGIGNDIYGISVHDNGDTEFTRLIAKHNGKQGQQSFQLGLDEESDGTIRFMQLIPALIGLCDKNTDVTYVIDELERSMHPALSVEFVQSFLDSISSEDAGRRQLIFSTHEVWLMAADFIRRDEIWLTNKVNGETNLSRVSDFASAGVRSGSALSKQYMEGLLGGIPRV